MGVYPTLTSHKVYRKQHHYNNDNPEDNKQDGQNLALALNKKRKNIIQPNNNIMSRMNSVSQKARTWQEIVQRTGQNIILVKVIDRGIRTTSRKRTTRTTCSLDLQNVCVYPPYLTLN
jgi:hypothetical protein